MLDDKDEEAVPLKTRLGLEHLTLSIVHS